MTKIQIFKQKGNINGFIVSGHSGYAESGSDIVCSAVSSLSQMVCVGLENVLNLHPEIVIEEENAYLSCFLDESSVSTKEYEKAQVLFQSFVASVELLLKGDKKLKKYISMEVKNEIY